ncbi:hypothetical protein [Escherichia coli]|uniref:hypothetical protein n=1 Tax=Escherichia coli TaxID=562 RepID=UPI002FCD02C0
MPRHLTDTPVQPVIAGVVQRDGVNAVIFFARAAFLNQLVKQVVHAVMGGNKANLAAPCFQRQHSLSSSSSFSWNAASSMVTFPASANVARVAGQCLDLKTAGEIHNERQNVLVFVGDHFLADFFRCRINAFAHIATASIKFAGHLLVRTDIKVIAPAVFLLQ